MAKAKKLPSGKWRTQVYDYTEVLPDGRKKSICGLLQQIRKKNLNTWHHSLPLQKNLLQLQL